MSADYSPYAATLGEAEFATIIRLVKERFGIHLTEEKRSLVVGRLQKLLRSKGLPDFPAYCAYLTGDASGRALDELADCITTNHTFFGRESDHFEFFRTTALPEAIARRRALKDPDLRVWCAACSSGEEAYTLAMLQREAVRDAPESWTTGVLATDISARALAIAAEGAYPADRIEGLAPAQRNAWFERLPDGAWRARRELKAEITFRRFNLMNAALPFRRAFDIIFLRNVMIYFDRPTREALVRRLHAFTEPGGYLFIGHSETLGRESQYRYIRPAVYRKDPAPGP